MSDLDRMRHSAAHVMAKAVTDYIPGTKVAIGPPIDDGFYYDFDLPRELTPDDFPEIERRIAEQVAQSLEFQHTSWPVERARAHFEQLGELYKVELIDDLVRDQGVTEVGIYQHGDFVDLCRGPHVHDTSAIGPVKLLNVAGAYWRGDEHRPMLRRIYATAWPSQKELDDYLWRLDEARKRDHRRLGRELDLFSVSDEVGPGLILWHPKGARLRVVAEDFHRQAHLDNGYDWVFTPHVGRAQLWMTSGHLGFFKENMYAPMDVEGDEYYAKPMNCPFHIQIYKAHTRSYRELPKRYAEFGTVYRYERSGALHGLTRVRGFTQDDAHIFCRPDQVEEEIGRALGFSLFVLRAFGLSDFKAYLSTRPEKAVGDPADWRKAEAALRSAVETHGVAYELDEGGGAFYGPKIDLKVNDALGREWQLSTVQFDFNMPVRFGLEFIGEDGQPHAPYMVHRALLGSMERFFGVLIEHYGGAFPVWLAPIQAVVIPIADRHNDYAATVARQLTDVGLRVEVDERREKMQAKIRDAQMQKVPYMLVVGDREAQDGHAALRLRTGQNLGSTPVGTIIENVKQIVADRALELWPGV